MVVEGVWFVDFRPPRACQVSSCEVKVVAVSGLQILLDLSSGLFLPELNQVPCDASEEPFNPGC